MSKGFSLVEMVLYVALLTVVTLTIIQMLISISGIYRSIKLDRELEVAGTIAMESLLREIRNASSVNLGESVLDVNPGSITLNGVDESASPYVIKFIVDSGILKVSKDDEIPSAITASSITVSYLLFTHITNPVSRGVRVEIEVSGNAGPIYKSERYYGFTVMRGSY